MSTIGKRLAEFRSALGISQEDMAERTGTKTRTYQGYERDESEPKASFLAAVMAMGCDPQWLLTGRDQGGATSAAADVGALVHIPHYAVAFSAGRGRPCTPEDELFQDLTISEQWARTVTRRNPQNLIVAIAQGNSMEPTISDGATLLIDRTDQTLTNGRIYALAVDDILFVKRIRRTMKGETLLASDNPSFPDEQLDNDESREFRIIGQVVWSGRSIT